jgi:hypothetical protein
VTSAALLAILVGVATCWNRREGERPGSSDGPRAEAEAGHAAPVGSRTVRRALAWSGLVLGAFFALLVIASDVPGLILGPCP